jgi:pyruvate kinase
VRSATDIQRVREFIEARGKQIPIIAKIEKHEALEHIDSIVKATDAIMVARGDLGIEIPLEQVPMWQKELITLANRASKPVITATQMLESMISQPRPTRAEAADVANAILDGTDAVMLSGETARGAYPVEAVRTMTTIAQNIEAKYPHEQLALRRVSDASYTASTAIADSAARIAEQLGMEIIVTGTTSGNTARHISSFKPAARIIALTPIERVARKLPLVWGVEAVVVPSYRYIETMIETAEAYVLNEGLAKSGDLMVITSGMPVGEGRTNLIKVHRLP